MSFNMAEATARISAQTEGREKITALSNAVKDLSGEVKKFAAEAGVGGNAASRMAAEAQKAAQRTEQVGKSAGLAGHHMQNLAFQANDVVVGLMSGQKPMTVFMQQGTQIGQIMAQAGVGVGGLAKAVGGMVGNFAAAHPVLAVMAVAAGVAAGALSLITDEINKNSKVHVTWQDTALAAYEVVKNGIKDNLEAAFVSFGVTSTEVWDKVGSVTRTAVNWIIGVTSLVPRAISATWSKIPAGVADIFLSAANWAIDGVNKLIAKSVEGINNFIAGANGILSKVGLELPAIPTAQIDRLKNNYSGAGMALGEAFNGALKDTFFRDYVGDFGAALSDEAQAIARKREAANAKKGGKETGTAARDEFWKAFNENTNKAWGDFFKDSAEIAKDQTKWLAIQVSEDWNAMMADMAKGTAERVKPGIDRVKEHYDSFGGGMERAFRDYGTKIGTVGERAFAAWDRALGNTEDALVNFAMTGKLSFKDLANSIIADLIRIAIQQAIMKPLTKFLGGVFGFEKGGSFTSGVPIANANGNAFLGGQVQAFAGGGVVSRPTLFPMAAGRTGLMGEAGPEAIMPLRRLPSGRLGVETAGGAGGGVNVNVSVDASGSQVQGNGGNANELGRAIGMAVQAELVRQKRPGGLLAA